MADCVLTLDIGYGVDQPYYSNNIDIHRAIAGDNGLMWVTTATVSVPLTDPFATTTLEQGVYYWTRTPDGTIRWVLIPFASTVDFSDLVPIDPVTLDPAADPEPAWWAELEENIVSATVNGSGDLIFTKANATTLNAGHVVGAAGPDSWFNAHSYGAVGNGTTDDTTALQAAIDAAYAAGGGIVNIAHPTASVYRITGPITVKENVSLRGAGSSVLGLGASTIKLDSATAQVRIGNGSARGGGSGFFTVNGNNTGDPTGAVKIVAVQQVIEQISVTEAAGVGVYVYASQNCILHSVDVNSSGTDNMVIDGGTGGMVFLRCELTSAAGYGLKSTDSAPGGHPTFGYQYGPAHNEWLHCIVENYQTTGGNALVLIESGTRQTFRQCGFSNSSDDTLSSGYLVKITNDNFPTTVATKVEFDSCNFHGGNVKKYPIFYVKGTNAITRNVLTLSGSTWYQFSTAVYVTDGATEGHLHGDFAFTTVTAEYSALGAGSWFFWRKEESTGVFVRMPDASGAWAGTYPLMVAKSTDAGARMIMDNTGGIYYCTGANFTPLVSMTYDATNNVFSFTGLKYNGRVINKTTLFTIPSAAYALTTNAAVGGPVYGYTITGSATIASWAITGALDDQEITLLVYRSGTQLVTWPTNVRFAAGTAPALAADKRTYVKFRYQAATGLWYEVGRAADVPNT